MAELSLQPNHTVPYGTGLFLDTFLAVNCQATIIPSLRDKCLFLRPVRRIGTIPVRKEKAAAMILAIRGCFASVRTFDCLFDDLQRDTFVTKNLQPGFVNFPL